MNEAQRRIVGIAVLVIGLAIMLGWMDSMLYTDPLDFRKTWYVWIIGAAVIGGIEYYLFAD